MQKALILTVLVVLITNTVTAQSHQDERPFRIGTSLGYSFTGYREETYSSVNRYLNTLTFIIDGNIKRGNFLHSLNFGFFTGNAEMAAGERAALIRLPDPITGESYYLAVFPQNRSIRGYLEYALAHRLWGNETFPGYLGGGFRADTYMQFASYPGITALLSINLHASQKWIINSESGLILSVGVPVFGYAVRPGFVGVDYAMMQYAAENPLRIITLGRITSLHNHWAVFGDLKYHHQINPLLSLYSGLGFELSRINFPRPRTDAILRLSSGIAFTF
ncbi:MAG: hypothetical protein FWC97_03710 [Treponema sp.]|nr:hypothetical protein [Treponema sp.]